MSKFVIEGGHPLHGRHATPGNKNAALPMLAASLLASTPVRIRNLPLIRDVVAMLNLIGMTGARVSLDREAHEVEIDPSGLCNARLPPEVCARIRTSILFAGPLLARLRHAEIPPPGGDAIGRRPLDAHFAGLRALGASVDVSSGQYVFDAPGGLRAAPLHVLEEASVTASENIVMAAVLAKGTTELFNVACEPHVQNLCRMLQDMGADISGVGTNRLLVRGVESLRGTVATVWPDAIETASYLAAAAATGGSIEIGPTLEEDFEVLRRPFARFGVSWARDPDTGMLRFGGAPEGGLRVATESPGQIPKVEDGIWPAVPSDVLSALIVLATQADGLVLFFEKMFESRLYFVDRLIDMGASIVHCDPHRIVVRGPTRLQASHLHSPDIRAGMAMVIAGLCADGTTVIDNAESVDRGYEDLEAKLRALGAEIRREN